jgi:hypothetical protein
MTLRYSHLSPSHLLDAVEKLLDGTGTTTGTSESEPDERQLAEPGTARTHRGTKRATRRSRTGDLLITKLDQGETPPHQQELSHQKTEDSD